MVRTAVLVAALVCLCGAPAIARRSPVDAFDEALATKPDSPELAEACTRLLFVQPSVAVEKLRPVLAAKVSRAAAGVARFVLARQLLDGLAEVPPDKRDAVIEEARALLGQVVAEYADVPVGRRPAKEHAERALYEIENLMPGKRAPEIEGEDLDGKPMKLADFRGKVVVLSFWGAWCGPCVAALPHEKRVVEKLAGEPFALLGVNTDRDRGVATGVAAGKGVTWRSWWDGAPTGPISTRYNVTAFPMIYVIDAQGIIRHRDVPADEDVLLARVRELLPPRR